MKDKKVLTMRLMLVVLLLSLLALPLAGTVQAQDPEPNDPKPEAPPVEPEPPIPSLKAVDATLSTSPGVVPASVEATLAKGDSLITDKTATLPPTPPRLDMVLMVDLSGSYNNDLPNIKAKAPNIFTGIRNVVADSQFGLVTFVDYPFYWWGSAGWGDFAYRLDRDLTTDQATWVSAVNAMSTRNGVDSPESQYEALYQAATGAGRLLVHFQSGFDMLAPKRLSLTHQI